MYALERAVQAARRKPPSDVGALLANATSPSMSAEPVSLYAIHAIANLVNHVPTSETPCPAKNSR